MALVDLRGRQDEPEVSALIALGAGSRAAAERARRHCAGGGWMLIGWSDGADLVGCVAAERVSETEIALRTVAVAEPFQRRGHGRAMIDTLAAVATAERLSAVADDEAVGFFRRCGFTISGDGRSRRRERFSCVRRILLEPALADAAHAVTLAELERAIREAWGRDTSDDPDEWSAENPARGQCAGTARLVRELLGGEIVIAGVVRDGRRIERHAWNRLPSGIAIDLTREQFASGEAFEHPGAEEPIRTSRAAERYALLATRVHARLGGSPADLAATSGEATG